MCLRAIRSGLVWACIGAGLPVPAAADDIDLIVPAAARNRDGGGLTPPAGPGPRRYHTLVQASDFESIPESHRYITQMSVRPDASARVPATLHYDDLELRLSTTQRNSLSTTLADNIGEDETVVYHGPLTYFSDASGPAAGPRGVFSIGEGREFAPFFYDPDQGNLLIDLISSSGFTVTPAGAQIPADVQGVPHLGTVFFSPIDSPNPSSPFQANTNVVWELTFSTVPEPTEVVPLQAGDADMDSDFDQLDLVQVQVAAKYFTGQPATWGEGDWNGAPGGYEGNPPTGDSLFDQFDIIAALANGLYLTGQYATVKPTRHQDDAQPPILYEATPGELAVDAQVGTELASAKIDSAEGIFNGQYALGSFDLPSFANTAQPVTAKKLCPSDLSLVGSLAGGGGLGDVDLVHVPVPEPTTMFLVASGVLVIASIGRRMPKTR